MKVKYILSIATSALECLLYAGIIFGWPSLQYVLLRTGYFAELCEFNSTVPAQNNSLQSCEARDSAFNLVFTLATSIFPLFLFIAGNFFDRFGTWIFRSVILTGYTIGFICLTVSTPSTGWLLYPGIIILAVSGVNILLVNVPISILSEDYRPIVTALMNGCFDSSSVMFVVVKVMYDSGLNYHVFLYVMTAGIALMWAKTFLLMPRGHVPFPLPENYKYGICELRKSFATAAENKPGCSDHLKSDITKTFKECLKDPRYLTNIFYFVIIDLRLMFYFGSLLNWLQSHFVEDDIGYYLNVFNITLLFGAVVAPIHGMVVQIVTKFYKGKVGKEIAESRGLFVSACCTSLLAVCLSVTVLIPQTVYASFALVLLLRGFLYSNLYTFISIAFPCVHYGKLMGFLYLIASFVTALQYGLFQFSMKFDPDFNIVNYCFLVLCCLTFVHPVTLWFKVCRINIL